MVGCSLTCVCVILVPFFASASACSFPAIWQCPGIHCSAVCLCFALSCRIRRREYTKYIKSLQKVTELIKLLFPWNVKFTFHSTGSLYMFHFIYKILITLNIHYVHSPQTLVINEQSVAQVHLPFKCVLLRHSVRTTAVWVADRRVRLTGLR